MLLEGVSDPFSILQIEPTACRATLRSAFRAQARKFHPDRNPDSPETEARFRKVVAAYESALRIARGENVWDRQSKTTRAYRPVRPQFRYACGQCGDSFQYKDDCPICQVPTADTDRGEVPKFRQDKKVEVLIRQLLSRKPLPSWFHQQAVCRVFALLLTGLGGAVLLTGLALPGAFLFGFAFLLLTTDALETAPVFGRV